MPSSLPTIRQVSIALSTPCFPMATLAFLLLITSACTIAVGNMLSADDDRRAGKAIAGKHSCSASTHRGIDDGEIQRVVFDADVFG